MPLDHARSKTCAAVIIYPRCGAGLWLRRLESNQRGMDYETTLESRSSAPSNWLWRQDSNPFASLRASSAISRLTGGRLTAWLHHKTPLLRTGRREWIRTTDPVRPRHVR